MVTADVIVVGGGPAGSSCAWRLRRSGIEVLVLDRRNFPRPKPCAGWITPRVLQALEITQKTYPFSFRQIGTLTFHFPHLTIPVPTRQFAIRRVEFDDWLLKRAGVPVYHHEVIDIRREQGHFLIDGQYRSRVLVGAGGTSCPVYRTFFRTSRPRPADSLITALEAEFPAQIRDWRVRLWFGQNGLPGYSWYVPKDGGYVNIGIGGFAEALKHKGQTIRDHWAMFVQQLGEHSLLEEEPLDVRGHAYAIRSSAGPAYEDNCYILGDAAGLATRDMGEGIGPAVQSGILSARAIAGNGEYSVQSIRARSAFDILCPWASLMTGD